MDKKLVSIIVPVYNGEKYIEKTIEALMGNAYSNVELLIGNDASTDNTESILNKYSDSRIKVFTAKKNIGPGAMRNLLLSKAQGEYIAVHDADDFFHPEKFLQQVNCFESFADVDVVGTGANLRDSDGKIWRTIIPREKPSSIDWILQRSMIHASIMFRKKSLVTSRYHESLRVGEDYYFLTSLYLQGAKFSNLQSPYYIYNVNQAELTTRNLRLFKKIIAAKYEISKLFSFPKNYCFFLVNVAVISLGALRTKLRKYQ